MRYEVQQGMSNGWRNTWIVEGIPQTFDDKEVADIELDNFLAESVTAVRLGFLKNDVRREEFRVVQVEG